jgi:hypothetical protein
VKENVLAAAVLNRPIAAKDAHADESYDWRYWSAAGLW